jgi:hypothetical protein
MSAHVEPYNAQDDHPERAYKVVCPDCCKEWGWARPSFVGGLSHFYELAMLHDIQRHGYNGQEGGAEWVTIPSAESLTPACYP